MPLISSGDAGPKPSKPVSSKTQKLIQQRVQQALTRTLQVIQSSRSSVSSRPSPAAGTGASSGGRGSTGAAPSTGKSAPVSKSAWKADIDDLAAIGKFDIADLNTYLQDGIQSIGLLLTTLDNPLAQRALKTLRFSPKLVAALFGVTGDSSKKVREALFGDTDKFGSRQLQAVDRLLSLRPHSWGQVDLWGYDGLTRQSTSCESLLRALGITVSGSIGITDEALQNYCTGISGLALTFESLYENPQLADLIPEELRVSQAADYIEIFRMIMGEITINRTDILNLPSYSVSLDTVLASINSITGVNLFRAPYGYSFGHTIFDIFGSQYFVSEPDGFVLPGTLSPEVRAQVTLPQDIDSQRTAGMPMSSSNIAHELGHSFIAFSGMGARPRSPLTNSSVVESMKTWLIGRGLYLEDNRSDSENEVLANVFGSIALAMSDPHLNNTVVNELIASLSPEERQDLANALANARLFEMEPDMVAERVGAQPGRLVYTTVDTEEGIGANIRTITERRLTEIIGAAPDHSTEVVAISQVMISGQTWIYAQFNYSGARVYGLASPTVFANEDRQNLSHLPVVKAEDIAPYLPRGLNQ